MPVRSLNSSVFRWVDKEEVLNAVKKWASELKKDSNVLRVGIFGSLAEGRWGVGSDVDLVIVVKESSRPFWQRPLDFERVHLPVPVDIIVYTEREWEEVKKRKFGKLVEDKGIWL